MATAVSGAIPQPPPDYSPADYIGGDPIAAAIGTGHDYDETVKAQAAIDAAVAANGGNALTPEQQAAALAPFPSADVSLATGPAAARTALKAVGEWLASAWWWLKWGLIALAAIVLFVVLLGLYGRFRG